jgi:hypothetical protein
VGNHFGRTYVHGVHCKSLGECVFSDLTVLFDFQFDDNASFDFFFLSIKGLVSHCHFEVSLVG